MELYQFPLSHFCEKARWALDYKGCHYRIHNLLPGPHLWQTRRLAPKTHVPILTDGGHTVQGSAEIIDHLEELRPEPALTPADPGQAREAREWEAWADRDIGVHLRRYSYGHFMAYPAMLRSVLLARASASQRLWYPLLFPGVIRAMRKSMRIYPPKVAESRERLEAAFKRLDETLQSGGYLVGDTFSRADLAVCALLAPLVLPGNYDAPASDQRPEELIEFRERQRPRPFFAWVDSIYARHR
jgi:glutathione S-transferase